MSHEPAAGVADNPFVGPRAFERGDPLYGRDREAGHLRDLLIAERIVLLHSPSGAGKTSLIQAALVPRLEAARFDVQPIIRVGLELSPGAGYELAETNRYVASVRLSLDPDRELTRQPLDLAGYLASRQPAAAGRRRSELLIFDQFEEVLTVDPTDYLGRVEFFRQLGEALLDPHRWALFAIRDEFVAGLEPFARAIPTRLSTTYRLDLLSTAAAAEAIRGPAARIGTEVTRAALELLLRDLARVRYRGADGLTAERAGQYIEPVQLQVVCRRLWTRLPPGTAAIDERALAELGSTDDALADFYSDEVARAASATHTGQRRIRDWFEHELITPQGIRGQVLVDSAPEAGLDARLVQALDDAHLIRVEERRGARWAELAHDRLIQPIQMDNARWRQANLSPLELQAPVWASTQQPAALLLRGKALRDAEVWAATHAADLEPQDRAYLDASRAARAENRRKRSALALIALLGLAILALGYIGLAQARDIATVRTGAARQAAAAATEVGAAGTQTAFWATQATEARVQLSYAVATQAVLATEVAQKGEASGRAAQTALALADARVYTSQANADLYASRESAAIEALAQASATVVAASSTVSATSGNTLLNTLPGVSGTPGPVPVVGNLVATSAPLAAPVAPTADAQSTALAVADLNYRDAVARVISANADADAAESAAATRVAAASGTAEASERNAATAVSGAASTATVAAGTAAAISTAATLQAATPSLAATGTPTPTPTASPEPATPLPAEPPSVTPMPTVTPTPATPTPPPPPTPTATPTPPPTSTPLPPSAPTPLTPAPAPSPSPTR